MLARDCSKYTVAVTPDVIQGWRNSGVGLLLVQAHPADYGQERSLEIMRAAQAAGVPWDAYIYQYIAYTDWLPAALETLELAAAEGLLPRKLWLDVEDVDSGKAWTLMQRAGAVVRDLERCDHWLAIHGRPRTAIYSAKWYWDPYMGVNQDAFSDRQLWAAQYDDIADASVFTSFGGWQSCRIKQHAGSQADGTDLDVLSDAEAAEVNGGTPVDDAERAQMQGRIDSLSTTVSVMGGDVADSLANTGAVLHKQATAKRMNRAQIGGSAGNVDSVVAELRRLRAEAG